LCARGRLAFGAKRFLDSKTNTLTVLGGRRQDHVLSYQSNVYELNSHLFPPWVLSGSWTYHVSYVTWSFLGSHIDFSSLFNLDQALQRFGEWFSRNNMTFSGALEGTPVIDLTLYPRPLLRGSKLVVYSRLGFLGFFKEPDKKLDLVGGKLEGEETFEEALVRECREELGWSKDLLSEVTYLGHSLSSGVDTVLYELHLYQTNPQASLFTWIPIRSLFTSSLYQEWVPRLLYSWLMLHKGFLFPYFDSLTQFLNFPDAKWVGRRFHISVSQEAFYRSLLGFTINFVSDSTLPARKWVSYQEYLD